MYYTPGYLQSALWSTPLPTPHSSAPTAPVLCLALCGLSKTQGEWMNSIRMSLNAELKFEIGIRSLRNIQNFFDVLITEVLLGCTKNKQKT